ncbi:hypothetical protein PCCS19_30040 [Paenibacillus sp. CCS19]|uniref:TauD/TfdA family dioxygenase n=1 Tax=Paenibacillus sp. CCS19 TaxID=3158387 RepID=UPI00256CE09C|nr:TauD/TfdA family dioxygenase [Paenibacillus cellulosilyticus]GMK39949.1 hypothetical protein PCCS19_30040 [Paenibacillus cellulosilyticus]
MSSTMSMNIRTYFLNEGQRLPLVVEPLEPNINAVEWAVDNKDWIRNQLAEYGGVLFRGFRVKDESVFEQMIHGLSGELLEYKERSSPRSQIAGNIYTSTDYPAHQRIFFHNENSYAHAYPMKISFYCKTPALKWGETPIADVRNVYKRIPEPIRTKFEQKRVLYIRNFKQGVGLSWESVFQSSDPKVVEQYCKDAGYAFQWMQDGGLRVARTGPAVIEHPITKEPLWFNHAAFFHVSTLDESIREALLTIYKPIELPNNTYYGDGTEIEPEVLDLIREAYDAESIKFTWELNDVLLLDNLMVAHARERFEGPRKILVCMSELTKG